MGSEMRFVQWLFRSVLSVLVWVAVVVFALLLLGRCQDSSTSGPGEGRRSLDLTLPLQTDALALVCPKSLLLSGMLDRRQSGMLEQIQDLYTSVWAVERKAQSLGCERWRAGIRIYNVEVLGAYVSFTASPDAHDRLFFTTPVHLVNTVQSSSTGSVLAGQPEHPHLSRSLGQDAKPCYEDGEHVAFTGVVGREELVMADDTATTVTILTVDAPVCIRPVPGMGGEERRFISRFQLIDGGRVHDGQRRVQGRLSTGNVTQYYAVPDAIEVGDKEVDADAASHK